MTESTQGGGSDSGSVIEQRETRVAAEPDVVTAGETAAQAELEAGRERSEERRGEGSADPVRVEVEEEPAGKPEERSTLYKNQEENAAAVAHPPKIEPTRANDPAADRPTPAVAPPAPRRSTRRAAVTAMTMMTTTSAPPPSSSPPSPSTVRSETPRPPESEDSKGPTEDDAIVAFVERGGSLAAAAARFGLSRAEVTRILKDKTVSPTTESAGATPVVVAVPEATPAVTPTPMPTPSPPMGGVGLILTKAAREKNPGRREENGSDGGDVAMAEQQPTQLKRTASNAGLQPTHSSQLPVVAPKTKRVRKTRAEKLTILQFVDQGGTHVAAAEKFGVSRTAVTKMVKEREIIMGDAAAAAAALMSTAPLPNTTVATPNGTLATDAVSRTDVSHNGSADIKNGGTTQKRERPTRQTPNGNSRKNAPAAVSPQAGTSGPVKARRVRKTNEEKLQILEFVERGGSQGAAAEKFGVSRTAVTKMVKEKEAISAQVLSGMSNHRKVLQYQHKLSIIEDMLYKWQVQVENDAPNLKITGDLLQSKAVEFRDKILNDFKDDLQPDVVQSLTDFKASNGWLHRYLQRRNLRTAARREDHQVQNAHEPPSHPFSMDLFLSSVRQQLDTVPLKCIWNLDEVALLPRSLVTPSVVSDGLAASDRRIIVSLLVSAAGEKFKPQVLTTADRSIIQETLGTLPIMHTTQLSSWQDTTTLVMYLQAVSSEAKNRSETWYILLDGSPSHLALVHLVDPTGSLDRGFRFENLVLFLLPPHAAHEHQPIHHGISRVFKAAYRSSMLSAILSASGQATTTESADDKRSLLDLQSLFEITRILGWIADAWNFLPPQLIRHCWVRQGLLSPSQVAEISQDSSRVIEAEVFQSLVLTITRLMAADDGKLAQLLGLPLTSTGLVNDIVNAMITVDDNEPTERIEEVSISPDQGMVDYDHSSDLRALV